MLSSHTTWFTLCLIEHFILNSECHVTAHTSLVFNLITKVPCVRFIYLLDVTCGMELMCGDGVAGSKLAWT